jgi:O-antigen/teichoic acid export membrane protein
VYAGLRRHGSGLALSGANQMVSSLTNFGIVLYLIRVLDKEQFGLYGLGFALVLFIGALISAAIAVQYVVNRPDQLPDDLDVYAVNHALAIGLIGVLLVLIAAFVTNMLNSSQYSRWDEISIGLPLAIATSFFAMREFLMRVAFSEHKEGIVLVSSLSVATFVFASFLWMYFAEYKPSAAVALYVYALGQAAGMIQAIFALKLPWKEGRSAGVRQAFVDSWKGGRWSLMTSAVYNFRNQAHSFLAVPLLGATALADINAARVLLTPAVMAIPPTTQFLMPRLAHSRKMGSPHLIRKASVWIGSLTLLAVIYCILLLANSSWLVPMALGNNYEHVTSLVAVWSLFAVGLAIRNGLTVVVMVLKCFRFLFLANVFTTILMLVLIPLAARTNGPIGIVIVMTGTEWLLSVILISKLFINSKVSNDSSSY